MPAAAAFALAAVPGPASALDPALPISQYPLMKWGAGSLPGPGIRAMVQAEDRYLWLGTSAGLVRFDGATFVVHDPGNTPGAGEGGVTTLVKWRAGELVYGTQSGDLVHVTQERFTRIPHQAGRGFVCSLFVDRAGTLWFALFGRGVHWWTGSGPAAAGPPRPVPLAFTEDARGGVYFGTEHNGLCAANAEAQGRNERCVPDTKAPPASLPHFMGTPDAIQALHTDRAGALWIGTPNGAFRWDGRRLEGFGRKDGLSHDNVQAILEDADGNVWVGTSGGLNRRTPSGRWSAFTIAEGLSDNDVRSLLEDDEGNLWVGTADGLNCLFRPRLVTYGRVEGLGDHHASSVAAGAGGSVWIGSTTGTLHHLVNGRIETFPLPRAPGHRHILSLHQGRDGSVWTRANNRVYRLKDGVAREYATPGRLSALAEDERGVLFHFMKFGLARFDGTGFVPSEWALPPLEDGYVHAIHPARDGTLWVAAPDVLVHLQPGGARSYTVKDGLPGNRVRWFSEDADGSVWMATEGGLAHVRDGAIRALTTAHGLPENYLRLVLDDELGFLWLVSSGSIFRLYKHEVLDVLAGRRTRVVPIRFGASDGLETTESPPTNNPGFRAPDGRLWIATARGVTVVDPKDVRLDDAAPRIHIQRAMVNDADATIDYTAMQFRFPGALRFRHRLLGHEDRWVDAGQSRTASYRNLKPGDYSFEVMASNHLGLWNGTPATHSISIRLPFHHTWMFYLLASLAAGVPLVAFAVHQVRIKQIETRLAATAAERMRIARELHDTLAQGLAGTTIQLDAAMTVLPDKPEAARDHVALGQAMVRSTLDEVRRSISVLRAQTANGGGLESAVWECLRPIAEPAGLETHIAVGGERRELPAEVERNLLRIAHEAVTNTVRHASARNVTVAVTFASDGVHLQVRDDGRGFDAAPWLTRRRRDRFGLLGMLERAQSLGGELRVTSGECHGTEVTCRLPYRSPRQDEARGGR